MSKAIKIYFASPLFSASEQIWNEMVVSRLRARGYDVFNPQSDNAANDKDNPNTVVSAKSIFNGDTPYVESANIIVANLDGLAIDPGLAAECGIFWSLKKIGEDEFGNNYQKGIVGFRTDIRKNGEGDQRFYFNQYVIGLIEDIGEIVDLDIFNCDGDWDKCLEPLLDAIDKLAQS